MKPPATKQVTPLRTSLARLLLSILWAVTPLAHAAHPATQLVRHGEAALRIDPEQSRRDAETALKLLQQQPDADLQVQALLQLVDYYAERDKAVAQQFLDQAQALLNSVKRIGLAASVANYQGEIYESSGDNTTALQHYQHAVELASQANDDEMLAKALYSRGYIVGLQGQYAAGLQDLQRADQLFDKLKMPIYALNAMNSIALLYNRLGNYEQAISIYDRALKVQRDQGMRREQAVTLHNRGRAYENLQQWDNAEADFKNAKALCADLNYQRLEAYTLRGLAVVANAKDQPEAALTLLDQATDLQKATPDNRLQAQIAYARGVALHHLDKLADSARNLQTARDFFQKEELLNELSAVTQELAEVHSGMGNYKLAYQERTTSMNASTKMLKNQLDQRFTALKIEFDTERKEKENELLTRENAANLLALSQAAKAGRLQTLVIFLSIALTLAVSVLAWHQRRGKKRMSALAMTDELTKVANRRASLGNLGNLLKQHRNTAIMIIDIDHFKSINDKHGHLVGDEILKLLANTLQAMAREPLFTGRLGGEEFIMVLPNYTLEATLPLAETLRANVAELDVSPWLGSRTITISIGVTISINGDTPSSILYRADKALYAAKFAGRNCVRSNPDWQAANDQTSSNATQSVA